MALPAQTDANRHDGPRRNITFKVDDERVTTRDDRMTPNEILTLVHLDPASHYLVELKGREQVSYRNHGNDEIRVHDGSVFVSVSTGPTPVS
ncbi:hypothetical protein [Cryptosporangium sp. NPDC048952]|uniref:hypothetical protein n=1 Tax=Cryptosporangium sp. NPDC048952 TaxID=3363961 RepID=UPI00370FD6E1